MTAVALAVWAAAAPVLLPADRAALELNLRWTLARERVGGPPQVEVFADAGVWHLGARSVVEALDAAGVPFVVPDRTRLSPTAPAPLAAVVRPGGWARARRW